MESQRNGGGSPKTSSGNLQGDSPFPSLGGQSSPLLWEHVIDAQHSTQRLNFEVDATTALGLISSLIGRRPQLLAAADFVFGVDVHHGSPWCSGSKTDPRSTLSRRFGQFGRSGQRST